MLLILYLVHVIYGYGTYLAIKNCDMHAVLTSPYLVWGRFWLHTLSHCFVERWWEIRIYVHVYRYKFWTTRVNVAIPNCGYINFYSGRPSVLHAVPHTDSSLFGDYIHMRHKYNPWRCVACHFQVSRWKVRVTRVVSSSSWNQPNKLFVFDQCHWLNWNTL